MEGDGDQAWGQPRQWRGGWYPDYEGDQAQSQPWQWRAGRHPDSGGPYGDREEEHENAYREEEAEDNGRAPPRWMREEMFSLLVEQKSTLNEWVDAMIARNSSQSPEDPQLEITKMTTKDDPETYLRRFERLAQAAAWPKEEWAIILAPHLTGEAQLAVDTLPPWEVTDYERVKQTILRTRSISEGTYQQRLKETQLGIGDPVCFKGSERGQVRRARKKRAPLEASAWTQAKEDQHLDEKHKQEIELLRSSLFYQHQDDVRKLKKDLTDRYTSEIEELKRKHGLRLGELLMIEDEYHENLDVLEAQKHSISSQQEEIEKLEKENARLRDVGVQEEMRFKKELEQIKCKLIVEHAEKLRRTRKEVQEMERIHKAETEEWKSKWVDMEKKSEERLSRVYKDLESKAEIEKRDFQRQYELQEAEMIGLQEQQASRIVELEKSLEEHQNRVQQLEAQVKQLGEQSQKDPSVAEFSFKVALKDKEQEVERLFDQVKTLQIKLEEIKQQQKSKPTVSAEDVKFVGSEKDRVQAELTTEVSKAIWEVQLQNVSKGLGVKVSVLQREAQELK